MGPKKTYNAASKDKTHSEMAKLQIQYNLLLKENNLLRKKQDSLLEDNRLMKVQLENERKTSRDLKNEKTNYYSRRNQLEELFLNCVEETRRDIERRKSVTLARTNNLNSHLHKGSKKHDDSLESAIKNEHFTSSDKRKVLELLLSNENVLLFLYEKLFPRPITTSTLLNQTQPIASGSSAFGSQQQMQDLHFRPKTAVSAAMKQPPARLNTKSQQHLRLSMTGKPIKFRQMSSSNPSGIFNDDATSLPMTAAASSSVVTRSNSNVRHHKTRTGGILNNSSTTMFKRN